MSRILIACPPWEGHLNPTIGVATVLQSMGHEVAWIAHDAVHHLLGQANVFSAGAIPEVAQCSSEVRGLAALQNCWNDWYFPVAISMDAAVLNAIARFSPDAMLVDQQAIGAALRAHQTGLPWLTLASSPGELATRRDHPSILQWTKALVEKLARQLGIGSIPNDALFSSFGCIMPSCPALMGPVPDDLLVHDVGCLARHRRSSTINQEVSPSGLRILVTLGTFDHEANAKLLQDTLAAAHELGSRTHWTIVDPNGLLGTDDGHEYITIQRRIRQIDVLPGVAAVVCHGGHNTIAESLLFGIPVVVAPIKNDQPYIAQKVVEAGAGLRIRSAHVTASHIASAVGRVITEPHFRDAAQRMSIALSGAEERVSALLASWLADPSRPLTPHPFTSVRSVDR